MKEIPLGNSQNAKVDDEDKAEYRIQKTVLGTPYGEYRIPIRYPLVSNL